MTEKAFLTRSQVALLFGVSPHTITRWAKQGLLTSIVTLGGQRRYPREAVLEVLREVSRGIAYEPAAKVSTAAG
ncbi:MAG: helix-turn-helix domain-containing protein [Chloroflexi bacterium]|nr:helix-turn-helix domain-containing protein [Chloroflexota bacterium]